MVIFHVSAVDVALEVHPLTARFSFSSEGNARITLYAANGNARTFDYQAGDVGKKPSLLRSACSID